MTEHLPVDVLLIEDNAQDEEMTLCALRRQDGAARVAVVRDGEEALEFLFGPKSGDMSPAARPKLVVLDLKLPKVSGVEVLRRLKAEPETREIPVVVLTSSRHHRDLEACYALGVNSYVVKPVSFEKYLDAVSQLGGYWLDLNEVKQ